MKDIIEKVALGVIIVLLVFGVVAIAFGITYMTCSGIWWLICLVISREFLWTEALAFWIVVQLISVLFYDEHRR